MWSLDGSLAGACCIIAILKKAEVTIHLNMMLLINLLIKWSYHSCFETGKACYDGYQSKESIFLKDQPKPLSDEGLIQHLQSPHQIHFHNFGLNNEDQKAGISKINEKLEIMFPHYHVMNKSMGDPAFVNPWYKVYSQADNKTKTFFSTSEPSGNEIRSSDMESNNDYVFISTIS
ncbi:hypothetical protein VP01_850g2 [Puccinia sorghi]|uniref:Uncharacterized protein n=1 Tax=Puccinia sorghi TaxID=27349 RepID=A0A0L6UB94_9BASI|nr:hypothetical protein VP01_850g2 [Puccinia sorghi]